MQGNNNPNTTQPPVRERPLQKSMFLPQHRSPQNIIAPTLQQNQGEIPMFNPLKRSLLQNPNTNSFSPQYQFRTPANPSFSSQNFQQPPPIQGQFATLQYKKGSQSQLINHSFNLSNMKQGGLIDRNVEENAQIINKNFSKTDKHPLGQTKAAKINDSYGQQQQKIIQIVNLIKQKHLPALVDIVKKELHQEINSFKVQFNRFKEQVKTSLQRFSNSGIARDKTPVKRSKQKDSELAELQKQLFLLESRLKKVQTTTTSNYSYFGQQINKICQRFTQKQNQKSIFKISNIKSSLPAIMLEYKQLFTVKKAQNQVNKRTVSEDIMLSVCNYFVDKQGYLMDHENHYLVDNKGNQIRLQEKHIKLLQIHKILYR